MNNNKADREAFDDKCMQAFGEAEPFQYAILTSNDAKRDTTNVESRYRYFKTGYQAAHAASEKRIAELEEEKQNLKLANIDGNNWFDALKVDFDKLQADNKRLLDALQLAHDHLDIEALKISHCKDYAVIKQAIPPPTESLEDK